MLPPLCPSCQWWCSYSMIQGKVQVRFSYEPLLGTNPVQDPHQMVSELTEGFTNNQVQIQAW